MLYFKVMSRHLTKKQKAFASEYINSGNGVKSALIAYDTKDYATANAISVENLQKPSVREYIESHADRAVSVVLSLMESAENETVRLNSAKDVLDRAGYGAIDKSLSMTANVSAEEARKSLVELMQSFRKAS